MQQIVTTLPLANDTLETILLQCREQELAAQEKLYRICYPQLIRTCYRYAGDMDGAGIIFNNAMLRIFRHLPKYREEGRFLGWAKAIVVHCCLDFVRQRTRFREEQILSGVPEDIQVNEEVFEKISAREVQELARQLPPATAAVFNLFIYEGFSHREIGKALGISEGTSKWHVNEGRRLLKTKLESFLNRS